MEEQVSDILEKEGGLELAMAKLASSQHLATLKAYLANYDSQVWTDIKASCTGDAEKDFSVANRKTAGIQALSDLIRHCQEALSSVSPEKARNRDE